MTVPGAPEKTAVFTSPPNPTIKTDSKGHGQYLLQNGVNPTVLVNGDNWPVKHPPGISVCRRGSRRKQWGF